MNIFRISGVFFLATSMCLVSCSKTGPAGPQGSQGAPGKQGEQGPQGIPGAAGSTIYSGSGSPATSTGQDGDYYLDKSTGNLYGPKTDNGWGDPVSLKGSQGNEGATGPQGPAGAQGPEGEQGATGSQGPQGPQGEKGAPGATGAQGPAGQNGKDGSQIISGTSAPADATGKVGDYYWDTSSFTLYGPKTSSGWGAGVLLKGAKGDKGDPGTANVMYSDWLKFDPWPDTLNNNKYQMYITEPKLTLNFIKNGGTVLSYLLFFHTRGQDTTDFTMYSLPAGSFPTGFLGFNSTSTLNLIVTYYGNTSGIGLYVTTDGGFLPPAPPLFLQDQPDPEDPTIEYHYRFRYILVPGGVHLRRSVAPPDVKNYKATCEYYGIPE